MKILIWIIFLAGTPLLWFLWIRILWNKWLLKSEDREITGSAADALAKIGSRPAIKVLVASLENQKDLIRIVAARALVKVKDPQTVKPLVKALLDSNEEVCSEAAEALAEIKSADAVEPLISLLLNTSSTCARIAAIEALGKINDSRAIEPLIRILKIGSGRARKAAATVLGQFNDPRILEHLVQAIEDTEASSEAVKSIKAIDPEWFQSKAALPYFLSHLCDPFIREDIDEALEKIDPEWHQSEAALNAVPQFISALKNEDSIIRIKAVNALGKIKDKTTTKQLLTLLKDKYAVREAATLAIRQIDPDFQIDQLLKKFNDEKAKEDEKAKQERKKQRKQLEQEAEKSNIEDLIEELIEIGRSEGFMATATGGIYDEHKRNIRARRIGEILNKKGGLELMRTIGMAVANSIPDQSRHLEFCWHQIGHWIA